MRNINYNWVLVMVALVYVTINDASAQDISFDNLNANSGHDKTINWSLPGVTSSPGFGHRFIYASTTTNRAYLKLQFRHNSSNWADFMKFTTDGNLEVYGNSYFNGQFGIGVMPSGSYKFRVSGGRSLFEDMVIARSLMVQGDNLGRDSQEGSIYFHHQGNNTHRLRFTSSTLYFENCSNLVGFGYGSSGKPNFSVEGRILLPESSTSSSDRTGIGLLGSSSEFLYDNEYLNTYGIGFHKFKDDSGTSDPVGNNLYINSFFGIDFFTADISGVYKPRMRINCRGNVGIGTTESKYSLQIGDGSGATKSLILAVNNGIAESGIIGFQEGTANKYMRFSYNSINNILKLTSDYGDIIHFSRTNKTVGIGTTLENNPNGYLLAVNGTIGAKEVVVENTSSAWPDYVFEKDYELIPLVHLERFVQTNKHLPEIPSASEIEENGINIGDMHVVLVKKIEELTLYLFEQNKRMDLLQQEIIELKNK
jgi:hypothetical protein